MDILDKITYSLFGFIVALGGFFLGIGKPIYIRGVQMPPTMAGWLFFIAGVAFIIWTLFKKFPSRPKGKR